MFGVGDVREVVDGPKYCTLEEKCEPRGGSQWRHEPVFRVTYKTRISCSLNVESNMMLGWMRSTVLKCKTATES